jgi:RNA polymerase sigma-70 factor (ECF subfamily)
MKSKKCLVVFLTLTTVFALTVTPVYARGCGGAIAAAVEKYADTVRRICFIHLKNYSDAEDVFQEVFLKYLYRDAPFESDAHEKAWLIRVAVNACKDTLKNFFRRNVDSLERIAEEPFYTREDNRYVLSAVLNLPAHYRNVIYLFYYEGYTAAEIGKILNKRENTVYTWLSRARAALASVAVIFFMGAFLYFTPRAYVDIDVNPSVAVVLNRFDRVIKSYAHNADGAGILSGVNIKHKAYGEAVTLLIDEMVRNKYAPANSLISISLQADEKKETLLLSTIKTTVRQCHRTAQIDAFIIGSEIRDAAYAMNLSPAKYLAIQKLLEVDATATVEGCRNRSIGEIKQRTAECMGGVGNSRHRKRGAGE